LDSDDLFLPDKLLKQIGVLDERLDLGLVAGGYLEVDKQLAVLREVRPWQSHPRLDLPAFLSGCPIIPNSVLVRREWLERAGLFDETMRYVEDWDLWLRMSRLGCRMEWLEEVVCCYRIHGSNMARHAQLMKAGMLTMLDKLYVQPDLPSEIVDLRDRAYANVYLDVAARAYAAGDVEAGKECLAIAIEREPALLEGNPPRVLDSLASFAQGPLAGDANVFMERLVNHLPAGASLSHWSSIRKARGLLHAVAAFEHYEYQDYWRAVKEVALTLVRDPSWLRHRGLISIGGRALVRVWSHG
jgi:hypothetical protein